MPGGIVVAVLLIFVAAGLALVAAQLWGKAPDHEADNEDEEDE